MTPEQEAHLAVIKAEFVAEVDLKYRKGQERHGGDLFKMCPLRLNEEALAEAIDQVVYLLTQRDKLREQMKHGRANWSL